MIVKKSAKSSLPPLDAGTYTAICVGIVGIGEQHNEKWNNYSDKIIFMFELPTETIEVDGEKKPRWMSREFTASLSDKSNLKPFVETWRGRTLTAEEIGGGIELFEFIKKPCLLSVVHDTKDDGTVYGNIAGVMGVPKGMPVPELVSDVIEFDADKWDDDVFAKLPEWIQNKIKKSTQYQKLYARDEHTDLPAENVTKRSAPF